MLQDTGERIIPPKNGEVSYLFNRHRMAYIFASDFAKQKIVLDVGCGTGYGSQILSISANKVYAIDYSKDAISFAKRNYPHARLNYIVMDANSIGFRDNTFPLIVSFQVIEHMPFLDRYLTELIRVLKDDGVIIISTPNIPPAQKKEGPYNEFHYNELTFKEAKELMEFYFDEVEFYGTQYRRKNVLRTVIQKSCLYQIVGRKISRENIIKKMAKSTMKLDDFVVTKNNIHKAMDLIIVARRPKKHFKEAGG